MYVLFVLSLLFLTHSFTWISDSQDCWGQLSCFTIYRRPLQYQFTPLQYPSSTKTINSDVFCPSELPPRLCYLCPYSLGLQGSDVTLTFFVLTSETNGYVYPLRSHAHGEVPTVKRKTRANLQGGNALPSSVLPAERAHMSP